MSAKYRGAIAGITLISLIVVTIGPDSWHFGLGVNIAFITFPLSYAIVGHYLLSGEKYYSSYSNRAALESAIIGVIATLLLLAVRQLPLYRPPNELIRMLIGITLGVATYYYLHATREVHEEISSWLAVLFCLPIVLVASAPYSH